MSTYKVCIWQCDSLGFWWWKVFRVQATSNICLVVWAAISFFKVTDKNNKSLWTPRFCWNMVWRDLENVKAKNRFKGLHYSGKIWLLCWMRQTCYLANHLKVLLRDCLCYMKAVQLLLSAKTTSFWYFHSRGTCFNLLLIPNLLQNKVVTFQIAEETPSHFEFHFAYSEMEKKHIKTSEHKCFGGCI